MWNAFVRLSIAMGRIVAMGFFFHLFCSNLRIDTDSLLFNSFVRGEK